MPSEPIWRTACSKYRSMTMPLTSSAMAKPRSGSSVLVRSVIDVFCVNCATSASIP